MSDETEETLLVHEDEKEDLDSVEETPKPVKKKDPKRVKQGLKLAAIGQKAKEEKMRKKVIDEMTKPSTWVLMGVSLTTIGFLGLWYFVSPQREPYVHIEPVKEELNPKKNTNRNYFN